MGCAGSQHDDETTPEDPRLSLVAKTEVAAEPIVAAVSSPPPPPLAASPPAAASAPSKPPPVLRSATTGSFDPFAEPHPAGYVRTFAGSGARGRTDGPTASATFDAPTGVAVSDVTQTLYVTDAGGLRAVSLDGSGVVETLAPLGSAAGGGLRSATAVAVSSTGVFAYVTDRLGGAVFEWSQRNRTLRAVVSGAPDVLVAPSAIEIDDNNSILYVADERANTIVRLNLKAAGSEPMAAVLKHELIDAPASLSLDRNKTTGRAVLYVAVPKRGAILEIELHENFGASAVRLLGGAARPRTSHPRAVAVSHDRRSLLVADCNAILSHDLVAGGKEAATAGSKGGFRDSASNEAPAAEFSEPTGIATMAHYAHTLHGIFVADSKNNRIRQVYI